MSSPLTSRPRRDAALAFSLLTALPLRAEWPDRERPDVAGYFPLVGLVLGGMTVALLWLAGRVPVVETMLEERSALIAVLVVAAWAMTTRMLHWDGLADVADAVWGGNSPARRLEIMADSATGAFGTTAVVLVAFAQITALAPLLAEAFLAPIVLALVAGRLAASFGAWLGRPARPGGLGAAVAGRPGALSLAAALLATGVAVGACAAWLPPGSAAVLAAVALVAAPVVPHVLSLPVRGITGDVLGASVLLTETAVLIAASLVLT